MSVKNTNAPQSSLCSGNHVPNLSYNKTVLLRDRKRRTARAPDFVSPFCVAIFVSPFCVAIFVSPFFVSPFFVPPPENIGPWDPPGVGLGTGRVWGGVHGTRRGYGAGIGLGVPLRHITDTHL